MTVKLNPEQVRMIRSLIAAGIERHEIALHFGVSRDALKDLMYGRTWPDVGGTIQDKPHPTRQYFRRSPWTED
jgi:hypothetical protein